MRARFFALMALVLGLASCQNDFDGVKQNAKGEVNFQLTVAAPDLGATRAGENGMADDQQAFDSAFGAIDYLQGAVRGDERRIDWGDVDLRYTLEVYDKADDYTDAKPIKDRMVIIKDSYETVKFELRLVPNRDYHFVIFADFVEEGLWQDTNLNEGVDYQKDLGKHHIIGATLADITITEDGINDECTDAYFATKDIRVSNAAPQEIVLKRPYGKLRVIATDLAELNLNVEPKSVKVAYTAKHPAAFNALTGEIEETVETEFEYVYDYESIYNEGVTKEDLATHFYTAGYDNYDNYGMINDNGVKRHTHMTLFTDYILAKDDQTAYHFEMEVYDAKGELIKATEFATDIPVQRNYLTTVIGNVLTTATDIEVRIDDNFAGYNYFNLWDGKSATMPEYDAETKTYLIREASELAWFAAQVNDTTRAANTFKGYTVKLVQDIHLNGERWNPIGATGLFEGTFDGNGHTIQDLFVYETGKASAGLFATSRGLIKNLRVVNAEIYGQYKAAVIVGDGLCSRVEGCEVNHAVVLSTPYNKNEANNVGAIVGYLSGEPTAYVKDCIVKNAEITAYRKVGGVVGAANEAAEVTGNEVYSTVITADMTAEYSEVKPADIGYIVGWAAATATVSDNTPAGGINTANSEAVYAFVKVKDAAGINQNSDVSVVLPAGEYNLTEDVKSQSIHVEGDVEITAGKIETGTPNQYGFVAEGEDTSLTINAADINSLGGGIGASDGAQVTFNDGKLAVNSASTSGRYLIYAVGEGTVVTVNGGEFSFSKTLNQKRAYVYCGAGAKVIINAGTFGPASSRSGYTDGILGDGETIIYGGTFGFDPTKWVAPGCTVKKEGSNWVVKAPVVVEDAAGLADAIANAEEGSTIALSENVNYGAVTATELKNVTIKGAEGAVMIFKTDANTKLENVTLKGVNFEYTGATADCGIVIDANAQIDNLVVEGCTFTGTGAKAGRGISGLNNNATIKLNGCNFKDLGYPIYAWGGYKSLEIVGCTFDNIKSWAIMPQSGFDGDLTVTGNTFKNCLGGGLVKAGTLTAGHTFTFTNNVITNCTIAGDHNWFQFNVSAGTAVVSGNTKDGADWTPGTAEGLK
uniref:DUF6562 domain-containing protein n=1 Tax=Alistipes sp. TaxID=1872444 RepID=UPI004056DECC